MIKQENKEKLMNWMKCQADLLDATKNMIIPTKKIPIILGFDESYTNWKEIHVGLMYEDKEHIMYATLQALTAHESMHIKATDYNQFMDYKINYKNKMKGKMSPSFALAMAQFVVNVVEDGRIEKIISDKYRGIGKYIYFLNEYIHEKQKEIPISNGFQSLQANMISYATRGCPHSPFQPEWKEEEALFEEIKPLIEAGVNAVRFRDCVLVCYEILLVLEEYLLKLTEEQQKQALLLNETDIGEQCREEQYNDGPARSFGQSSTSTNQKEKEKEEKKRDSFSSSNKNEEMEEKEGSPSFSSSEKEVKMLEEEMKERYEQAKRKKRKDKKQKREGKRVEEIPHNILSYKEVEVKSGIRMKVYPILLSKGMMLRREIEKMVTEKRKVKGRRRSGVIDQKLLPNLVNGTYDFRIFKQKKKGEESDFVFFCLKDHSGSMDVRSKEKHALDSLVVLEEGIKNIFPLKIQTFCADSDTVLHQTIRDFDDKGNNNHSFSFLKSSNRPRAGNCDYYSIQRAVNELISRPEKEKFLIILSDGLPSITKKSNSQGIQEVKKVVDEARKKGVNILSIAFGEKGFRKTLKPIFQFMYGKEYSIMVDPAEISKTLIEKIKRIIAN